MIIVGSDAWIGQFYWLTGVSIGLGITIKFLIPTYLSFSILLAQKILPPRLTCLWASPKEWTYVDLYYICIEPRHSCLTTHPMILPFYYVRVLIISKPYPTANRKTT